MIKALIFSKNRQLQLQALIESFLYYSGAYEQSITVLTPTFNDVKDLYYKFNVNYLFEQDHDGFHNAYKHFIFNLETDDIVIMLVDDVIFVKHFKLADLLILRESSRICDFSLRLGKNIEYFDQIATSIGGNFCGWRWKDQPSHFGYPFSLTSDAFNSFFLKQMLDYFKQNNIKLAIPNSLEDQGVKYCQTRTDLDLILSFNDYSITATFDVNRVQNLFLNDIRGDGSKTPEYFNEQFKQGKKINWKKLENLQYKDCFVGSMHEQLELI